MTQRQIVQLMVFSTLLAALALGHVYLRFFIADIKLQHYQLQKQSEKLLGQVRLLERENADLLSKLEPQRFAGEQLEMVDTDPVSRVMATIPPRLRDKYTSAMPMTTGNDGSLEEPSNRLEQLLLLLTDVNRAFAEEK